MPVLGALVICFLDPQFPRSSELLAQTHGVMCRADCVLACNQSWLQGNSTRPNTTATGGEEEGSRCWLHCTSELLRQRTTRHTTRPTTCHNSNITPKPTTAYYNTQQDTGIRQVRFMKTHDSDMSPLPAHLMPRFMVHPQHHHIPPPRTETFQDVVHRREGQNKHK